MKEKNPEKALSFFITRNIQKKEEKVEMNVQEILKYKPNERWNKILSKWNEKYNLTKDVQMPNKPNMTNFTSAAGLKAIFKDPKSMFKNIRKSVNQISLYAPFAKPSINLAKSKIFSLCFQPTQITLGMSESLVHY